MRRTLPLLFASLVVLSACNKASPPPQQPQTPRLTIAGAP